MTRKKCGKYKEVQRADLRKGDLIFTSGDGMSLLGYIVKHRGNLARILSRENIKKYLLDDQGVSFLIKKFDGGCYSHVALYDGKDGVIQAGWENGTHKMALEKLLNGQYYADVYRMKGRNTCDFAKVIEIANQKVKDKEIYDQDAIWVLLAYVLIRNNFVQGIDKERFWLLRRFFSNILQVITIEIERILETTPGEINKVTCSELVFTTFSEAGCEIRLTKSRTLTPPSAFSIRELEALQKSINEREGKGLVGFNDLE